VVDGREVTKKPNRHVAYWVGEHPCHANGDKIRSFENPSPPTDLGNGYGSITRFLHVRATAITSTKCRLTSAGSLARRRS
jgi:hypothetical protein